MKDQVYKLPAKNCNFLSLVASSIMFLFLFCNIQYTLLCVYNATKPALNKLSKELRKENDFLAMDFISSSEEQLQPANSIPSSYITTHFSSPRLSKDLSMVPSKILQM